MAINLEDIEYVEIEGYSNVPVVRVGGPKVFLKLMNKFKPAIIYLNKNKYDFDEDEVIVYDETSPNYKILQVGDHTLQYDVQDTYRERRGRKRYRSEKTLTEFLFYHDGVMYLLVGWNYNTIPDMLDGFSKGFKFGEIYYEAMREGFSDFKEYRECTSLGYKTKADYIEAEKLGFRGGYGRLQYLKYTEYKTHDKVEKNEYIDPQEFGDLKSRLDSEGKIYYDAKARGYKDFKEFTDGVTKGFKNATEYRDAVSKGFIHAIQYKIALKGGFQNAEEFETARKLEIKTKRKYEKYLEFKRVKKEYGFETIEEAHLFSILLNLKAGKKLSVSKLWENLQDEQNRFRFKRRAISSAKLPEWYTEKFEEEDEIKEFLTKNKSVSSIGTYDAEGEVFERGV